MKVPQLMAAMAITTASLAFFADESGFEASAAPDEPKKLEIDSEAAARGKKIVESHCLACHSIDGSKKIGLTLKDQWGRKIEQADGSEVLFDRAFFKESVVSPAKRITKGYANQMPAYLLKAEEQADLEEYVRSIGDPKLVLAADLLEGKEPKRRLNPRSTSGFCIACATRLPRSACSTLSTLE